MKNNQKEIIIKELEYFNKYWNVPTKTTKDIATSILSKLQKDEIMIARGKVDTSYKDYIKIGDEWCANVLRDKKLIGKNIILTAKVVKDE